MSRKVTRTIFALITIICILSSQQGFAGALAAEANDSSPAYLESVMDMIKDKYNGEVTDEELIEGAVKGMFDTMDPYTTYFSPKEAGEYMSEVGGAYGGIGVAITKMGDYLVITKVFEGSPAEKAGILLGDKIVKIGDTNVISVPAEKASELIKGESGTDVVVGIQREGKPLTISFTITRGSVKISPVSYKVQNDIGYIKIDAFNANTDENLSKALAVMDENKVNKIVLDLRNNPGGEVNQAVEVARKFVPQGLITRLSFKSQSIGDIEYYSYLDNPKYKLTLLVNGMSASASEILAGAVQDTNAGTLIGTKTYGKAKVQMLYPILTSEAYKKYQDQYGSQTVDVYDLMGTYGIVPLPDEIMGWVKITTGKYTTPKGRMIDLKGIDPDIYIDDYDIKNDIDVNNIIKLRKISKPTLSSESFDVYNAEKILKLSGYDVDTPDIKLDDKTFKAITKFQKDSGLFPYGTLDFTTQQALNSKLDKLILEIDKQYAKAVQVLNSTIEVKG